MLLRPHGEDEVGVLLGQEGKLVLRSFAPALAAPLSRADRDDRLDGVVAGALGVGRRIEERQHAVLLVRLEDALPGEDRPGDTRHRQDGEVAPAHLREHHHGEGDEKGDERGAQVGLLHDQRDRQQDEQERPPQIDEAVLPFPRSRLVAAEVAGHEHDDGELDELAGLQLHRADLEPAPRAEHLLALEGDAGEERKPAIIDEEEDPDGDDAQAHHHGLLRPERIG